MPSLRPTQVPTQIPTNGPTTSPSSAPTPIIVPEELLSLLSDVSFDGGESVQTDGTPQNDAAKWLTTSDNLNNLTEEQVIQRFALATFYYSADGDSWTNNNGWLSDESECTWFTRSLRRPVCDDNGVFVGLELAFNNLGGTMPPEIALLPSLTRISLGAGLRGNIRGTLPSELGLLTSMENFNLRDNLITGAIPAEFGNWTLLEVLDMSRNRMTGTIPSTIGQMTSLTRFNLAGNRLTGRVPSELAMAQLEDIRFNNNGLTGVVPRDVCNLFFVTSPTFYTDCGVPPGVDSEISCFCCSHCCSEAQGCFPIQ
jgi:hypothetical protein